METGGLRLGRRITGAFLGYHMHEDRHIAFKRVAYGSLQRGYIMPINWRGANDAQLLEQHGIGHNELFQRFFGGLAELDHGLTGNAHGILHEILHRIAAFAVIAGNAQCAEVHSHSTHVARNAHLVIVEDDDERGLGLADIVERFERHATGKGGIADERNDVLLVPPHITRPSQTARHRKRVGSMAGRMHIMGIAMGFREAGKPFVLTKRGEFRQATGNQHMGIRLMPHVEQEPVMR